MNNPAAIRPALADDLAALLPHFRAYQAHYKMLTAADEARTRDFLARLLDRPEEGFVLLSIERGSIVGFAAVYFTVSGLIAQRIAHLGDLYVVPERRRKGVGTALFNAVCDQAALRKIGLVRWFSLTSNTEVNRWYNRLVEPSGTFQLYLRPT